MASIFIVNGLPKKGGSAFGSPLYASDTLGHEFTVTTSETNTIDILGHEFTVELDIIDALGHEFTVELDIIDALGHEFTVELDTTDVLGHEFTVFLGATDSLGHEFTVSLDTLAVLGHEFTVKLDNIDTLGHEFSVVFNTTDILGHEFSVVFNITDVLSQEFIVALHASDILGHEFTAVINDTDVLGHEFTILQTQVQTFGLSISDVDMLGADTAIVREEPEQIQPKLPAVTEPEKTTEQQRIEESINKFETWVTAAEQMMQFLGVKLQNRRVRVDPAKNPAIRTAIRRLFGIDSDTITYDMFKKAIELRSELEEQGRIDTYGSNDGTSGTTKS